MKENIVATFSIAGYDPVINRKSLLEGVNRMWTGLEPLWQQTLSLAWDAFCSGTVPVGCVICDKEDQIVARGQNAIADLSSSSPLAGTDLAHAEMIAMSQLQKADHPEIREYILYTSLEPCPMCIGAAVMMNIRQIRYAARDALAGSLVLCTATPYLSSKRMTAELAEPVLEIFQLALVTAYELRRRHSRQAELLGLLQVDCPEGVAIGASLFEEGYLAKAVTESLTVEQVFDEVMARLH